LQRWIFYYQDFGEAPARTRRNHRKTIGSLRETGEGCFNAQHEAKLKEIIEDAPQLYLDEIQTKMMEETGILWGTTTLWTKLNKLGYSLKVAVLRAKQQNQGDVNDYHARLLDRVKHPQQLLFVDETARGANASRRRRAWAPRGATPIVIAPMVREYDKKYTIIGACNWDGFITEACHIVERDTDSDDNNPDRGTVNTMKFEHYIEHYLVPVLGRYELSESNSIVVMDNATIHNSNRIRELIEGSGALLVYTAPYSPELNPIEFMFGEYKKSLKRQSYDRTVYWLDVHHDSLESVSQDQAKQFFKTCEVPLINEWLEEREAELENDDDILPYPFNDILNYLVDLM
jgi:transposase